MGCLRKQLQSGNNTHYEAEAAVYLLEAVVRRCSVKKMFLEISQNLQENTCARLSFSIKLQASSLQLY